MNTPSQILRNINSEKFKGFDALDNNSACTDGAPGATIIIKKVNRHGFTFSWIKATIQFKYNGEFLGVSSRIVRSSTYFARLGHVLTRSLTITENITGPNLVPWGIPPFRERILEESEPRRTLIERILNRAP